LATNGLKLPSGNGLIGALAIRDLAHIDAGEKKATRDLIIYRTHWSPAEQCSILTYCASDVAALVELLTVMAPSIDWPRATKLRGRYMAAVARMERTGVPLDAMLHRELVENWEPLKLRLIAEVDRDYGVFSGTTFKQDSFEKYLQINRIPWPRLPSGRLALDSDTFREQVKVYPCLRLLHELRETQGRMRLNDIPVGKDHRARCLLSPFASVTGRNQPSSAKFVFGPATWIRGLVREREGRALAYVDFGNQEIAIAAGLSGDERMAEAYATDPYLAFAKSVGLAPPEATKQTHADIRQVCKTIVLGINYGMGPETMAARAEIAKAEAQNLLRLHRTTYPTFWRWSDNAVTAARFTGRMTTIFGWRRHDGRDAKQRSLMNFPMQANGAEMMRLAAIAATEAGIEVCCPVHDAFVISAPINRIDEAVASMRAIMSKAGRAVTGGLDVRTDVKVARWPDRYMDERGAEMWERVMGLLARLESRAAHYARDEVLTSATVGG
jgi:DNA polymerase family A